MVFGLFKKQDLIDRDTVHWIFDNFAWALNHFDAEIFFKETRLVTPSNELFPGRADNPHDMASLIFEKVKEYAGLTHWPTRLENEAELSQLEPPKLLLEGPLRSHRGTAPAKVDESHRLLVTYNPFALNDPEIMIANYAHVLSHYLASLSSEVPPGGKENWPHVTELLAVFLGFGLIMANTAFTKKIRSCGSCSGPAVERTNFLSQEDMTYALAIFCVVKDIPRREVMAYLKKSLHSFYKRALKDLENYAEEIERLRSFNSFPPN